MDLVNAQTYEGYTCLHLCIMHKSTKCLKVLLNYGGVNLMLKNLHERNAYDDSLNYNCR